MKKALLTGLVALALARTVPGQDALFQNDNIINYPITIDAITFVNNGLFAIPVNGNVTNLLVPSAGFALVNPTASAYDFSSVENYTNRGYMSVDTGFIFDTAPSIGGVRHPAANFVNENPGAIFSGSSTTFFSTNFTFFIGISPKLKISATNIINTGSLDVGIGGLMTVAGKSVDLSHGSIHVEGFDNSVPFLSQNSVLGISLGILDLGVISTNWGVGRQTNLLTEGNLTLPTPFSPGETVTNQTGNFLLTEQLLLPNALAFANTNIVSATNITYQFVFVLDTIGQVATDVRFEPFNDFALPIIHYTSVFTNAFTGFPDTNELFVADSFGAATNLQLITNGNGIAFTLNPAPSPVPANYSVARVFPGFDTLPAGNTAYITNLLTDAFGNSGSTTNDFTAMGLSVQPSSVAFDPFFPTQNITNIGGRVEISADGILDLTGTRMGGPNYFKLAATNAHFVGSSNAILQYPYGDIALRSTNGLLNFTNVTAPNLPRLNGPLDLRSFRWTNLTRITVTNANGNTNAATVTNRFHVLMALSALNPLVAPKIKDLFLRSTNGSANIVISDIINVTNSLFIDTKSLTITSNSPGDQSPMGQINILNSNIIWSTSLSTNLQNLTNFGAITAANGIYFQKRLSPNFPSGSDRPYVSFINHGTIATSGGNTIWATTVENSGLGSTGSFISALFGPINITATTASLSNGTLSALQGGMNLAAGSLTISNQNLLVGFKLSVSATNLLTDGGSSNNIWTVSDGFELLVKPPVGDLLGTTVSNNSFPNVSQNNKWAGIDRGVSTAGFLNNAAIGRLVLKGGNGASVFHYIALGASNALYVDQLELAGGATNRVNNIFTGLNVDSNMTIYFADAVIGSLDISEKLDGANGGRFHWVSNYVGRFSSTNITYPDAQTFQFNRALAASFTIDSDNDGTVNAADPTPFPEPFTAAAIALSISLTNQPSKAAVISWQAPSSSTNYVYFRTAQNTNWLVLTNFVQGPVGNRVTVIDPVLSGRLYKVRVDPAPQH